MYGSAFDFFNFAAYPPYDTLSSKFITVGQTQFDIYGGFVNKDLYIERLDTPPVIEGGRAIEGVDSGVLGATGADEPSQFVAPAYYGR